MKDFRPSNLVSIVFEVLFTVKVQNREHFTVCLGYQTLIPEMMSDMPLPLEKTETLRLSKGPGETLEKQLMLSDQLGDLVDVEISNFDLELQFVISTKANPEAGLMQSSFQSTSARRDPRLEPEQPKAWERDNSYDK